MASQTQRLEFGTSSNSSGGHGHLPHPTGTLSAGRAREWRVGVVVPGQGDSTVQTVHGLLSAEIAGRVHRGGLEQTMSGEVQSM